MERPTTIGSKPSSGWQLMALAGLGLVIVTTTLLVFHHEMVAAPPRSPKQMTAHARAAGEVDRASVSPLAVPADLPEIHPLSETDLASRVAKAVVRGMTGRAAEWLKSLSVPELSAYLRDNAVKVLMLDEG